MAKKIQIAPSMRSANWLRLGEEIQKLESAGADLFHFDVGDGHFIADLGASSDVIAAVKKITTIPLEVHLMVTNPEAAAEKYAAAGADIIIVHVEASENPRSLLESIRAAGKMPALALNPETPVSAIADLLPLVGKVSVMGVFPGKGGILVPGTTEKIKAIADMIALKKLDIILQIDGAVSLKTRAEFGDAGATSYIVGFPIFSEKDYSVGVESIRQNKKIEA